MESELSRGEILIIRKMIFPLKLIVIGISFLVLEINFFGFDLLNDTLALLLITSAVLRLTFIYNSKRYDFGMTYVSMVLILSVAASFFQIIKPELFEEYIQYFSYLSALQATALIVFCMSMYWFCDELNIKELAKYWQSAYLLFAFFLILPNAIFQLLVYFYNLREMISDIFWVLILIIYIILAFIPIIHMFQVSVKMLNYAKSYVPKEYSSKGAI